MFNLSTLEHRQPHARRSSDVHVSGHCHPQMIPRWDARRTWCLAIDRGRKRCDRGPAPRDVDLPNPPDSCCCRSKRSKKIMKSMKLDASLTEPECAWHDYRSD